MKRTRLPLGAACAAVLACLTPLAAQESGLGARSGVAVGGLQGLEGARAKPGIATGPTLTLPLNRWLAVQAELLYSAYGVWLTDAFAIQTAGDPYSLASFRYIQMPLFARLDVGRLVGAPFRATLYAGPHVSAMLTCRLDVPVPGAESVPCGSASSSPFSDMRTVETGAVGGGALAADLFGVMRLTADVRYQQGFARYSELYGLRNGLWAFAIGLSTLGLGGGAMGYGATPVPPPAIHTAPMVPDWTRPIKGVRM